MTRTEPVQVKYTKLLKAAQCCLNVLLSEPAQST